MRFDFATAPGTLPKDVLPSRYRLQFELDPASARFSASAAMALRVLKPVSGIVLHAHEFQPDSVTLAAADGWRQTLRGGPGTPQTRQLTPLDVVSLAAGDNTLHIAYRRTVQKTGQGLFGVSYSAQGQPQQMMATQLQAVYARRLFPSKARVETRSQKAREEASLGLCPAYDTLHALTLATTYKGIHGNYRHQFRIQWQGRARSDLFRTTANRSLRESGREDMA